MGDAAAEHEAAVPRAEAHPLAQEAERVAAALSERLAADAPAAGADHTSDNHGRARVVEEDAPRPSDAPPETAALAATGAAAAAASPEVVPETDEARAGEGATTRGAEPRVRVRGRAAAVGASVGESLKPRVERLREASSVVIDEAADDPGVRFLVIAAVLFLLFLLLWLLSFTLG